VSWVLAVDFGTSNTTAAFADDGGAPQLLQVENSQYLPSVVVADGEGNLLTGKVADRQAVMYPERAERVPKRALVAGGQVVLEGRPFPAEALAGAVLSKVYAEAVRFHGGTAPGTVVLTHPARWGEPLRERLRAAAGLAGMRDPVLLAEPEAAAWYYAPPVAGQLVAVFDLGGGTLDTAVLKAAGGGFVTAGPPGGDAHLGGEDFDALLLEWVGEQARKRDAGLWAELDGPRAARDRAHLRRDVTAGKEALSELTTYEVPVPGFAEGIHVRRPDLEELIGEPAGRAVAEMARTIAAVGITPGQLAALYLTGGSSRIPLIAQRLGEALGVVPQLRGDPKAAVVLGALTAHTHEGTQPQAATRTAQPQAETRQPPTAVAIPSGERRATTATGSSAVQTTASTAEKNVGSVMGETSQTQPRAQPATQQAEWRLWLLEKTRFEEKFRLSSPSHHRYHDITIKLGYYITVDERIAVRQPSGAFEWRGLQDRPHDLYDLTQEFGTRVTITFRAGISRIKSITLDIGGQKVIYNRIK
jgi:molecular chaperone DnaK (HSP70)